MKIIRVILSSIGLLTVIIGLFCFFDSSEDSTIYKKIKEQYSVFALDIPEDITFAGERIPLEDNNVRERFDRELLVNTYWHSNTFLSHKRANRWFPIIEPILKDQGVPDDFKYLALIESGLTNAVSPSGAKGFWQILEGTGKDYGLEINTVVDERYHLEKSTLVACDYLKKAYNRFGSWTSAAASYNMGMGGLRKQMNRQRDTTSYYNLLLNSETSRYVFRIIAAKEIHNNYKKYGFNYDEKHLYTKYEFKQVEVDTTINDLATFAFKFKINYKQLKILNPWLRDNYLANFSRKKYQIKIPINNTFLHKEEISNETINE